MTLETFGNKLFSGGMDGDFVMSSFPPKVVTKIPPVPVRSCSLAADRILVRKEASVNIWQLPTPNTELKKLLELKTKGDENIFSACISKSGRLFALSTIKYIRVFLLEVSETESNSQPKANLQRLSLIDEQTVLPNTLWHLRFINDKQILGISANGRKVVFLKINSDDSTILVSDCVPGPSLEDQETGEPNAVDDFELSDDSSYFCINSNNHLTVHSLDGNDLSYDSICSVPNYYAGVTSITFHPTKSMMLLTFSDHCVQVYDFHLKKIVFSEKIKKKFDDLQPFLGSAWIDNGMAAVLYQVDAMYLLQMKVNEEPVKKSRKSMASKTQENPERYNFSLKSCEKKQHKYLSYLQSYAKAEGEGLLAVEINPNSILEKLPPSFAKKRFGA